MSRPGCKQWIVAVLCALGLLASACGGSDEAKLPTFEHAVRGDLVDTDSFLDALRHSFRPGATARVEFAVVGGAGISGRGAVRYRAKTMDADLKIDDWRVKGASIDVKTVGESTYMRVPESRGLWVELNDGTDASGANLAADADPRKEIDDLRTTITEVRFSGTETLDGVRARRFQVTTKPKADTSSASPEAAHPTVTEYWFDSRDRVIRRQSVLQQSNSAAFTWTDWGKPVTIVRPKQESLITLKRLEQLRKRQVGQAGGN